MACCTAACSGKTVGPETGRGTGGAAGQSTAAGGEGGEPPPDNAPPGSLGSTHQDPPPSASGLNSGAPGDANKGDQILPPDDLAKQNARLQQAHDASATCVRSCNVLNSVCNDSGFNHCDLSCPGRFAGDAPCAALIEDAFACLADNVDRAIICTNGDPKVRCGVCDAALAALAKTCDTNLDCEF